jgi:hypothetical protein
MFGKSLLISVKQGDRPAREREESDGHYAADPPTTDDHPFDNRLDKLWQIIASQRYSLGMRQDNSRAHHATRSPQQHVRPGSAPVTLQATEWITREQAGEILGITAAGVGFFVRRGDLHPRPKKRHRPSLDRAEVERLAEARAETLARRQPMIPRQPRHPQDGNEWLSALQVANRLGMSRLWVDIRAQRGELPYTVGPQGRRSYRIDHVEAFAEERGLRASESALRQSWG